MLAVGSGLKAFQAIIDFLTNSQTTVILHRGNKQSQQKTFLCFHRYGLLFERSLNELGSVFPEICCNMGMEMSRLTRDGTAEPVLRDQILRRERGQENNKFPCSSETTCRVGDRTRLIHTLCLAICVTNSA